MILFLDSHNKNHFRHFLETFYEIRTYVFCKQLKWIPTPKNGLEQDEFDRVDTVYLLSYDPARGLLGGVRLLKTTSPNMLSKVFRVLCRTPQQIPCRPDIWESSRFCRDERKLENLKGEEREKLTFELLSALLVFGFTFKLSHIATVVDLRMERLLGEHGWPLERLGDERYMGTEKNPKRSQYAVAGLLEVKEDILARLLKKARITRPLFLRSPELSSPS